MTDGDEELELPEDDIAPAHEPTTEEIAESWLADDDFHNWLLGKGFERPGDTLPPPAVLFLAGLFGGERAARERAVQHSRADRAAELRSAADREKAVVERDAAVAARLAAWGDPARRVGEDASSMRSLGRWLVTRGEGAAVQTVWLTVKNARLREAVSAARARCQAEEAEYRRALAEQSAARGDTSKKLLQYLDGGGAAREPTPPPDHDLDDIARWVVAHRDLIDLGVSMRDSVFLLARECARWALAVQLDRLVKDRPADEARLRAEIAAILGGTAPEKLVALIEDEERNWRFVREEPVVHADAVLELGNEKEAVRATRERVTPEKLNKRILATVGRLRRDNKEHPLKTDVIDDTTGNRQRVSDAIDVMIAEGELVQVERRDGQAGLANGNT